MLRIRPSVPFPTGTEIGAPGVLDLGPAGQAVGGRHGDGPHRGLAEVLGDLQHELLAVGEDVLLSEPRHLERVVDRGQDAGLELHVDDGPDHLDDVSLSHAWFLSSSQPSALARSASAPPTMSSSSLVIRSCRALLYWMVRSPIISWAFLLAASIAVMRAPCSPAFDSRRAR